MTLTRRRLLITGSAFVELAILWACWPWLLTFVEFVYRTLDHYVAAGALTGS